MPPFTFSELRGGGGYHRGFAGGLFSGRRGRYDVDGGNFTTPQGEMSICLLYGCCPINSNINTNSIANPKNDNIVVSKKVYLLFSNIKNIETEKQHSFCVFYSVFTGDQSGRKG